MRRLWWVAACVVVLSCLFSLVGTQGEASALYTRAQINDKLIGGTGTAVSWDSSCYWQMRANRNAGQDPRSAINNGGSYASHTWVSIGGRGSQTQVEVNRGTSSVALQLNAITFVCSSLVSPDGAGADYASNNFRVVTSANAPNDRRPNPMGGSTNWPAFAGSRFRVDSASASPSGSVNLAGGTVLSYLRDNNSRYWFASPRGFTYTKSGGFTETTNVTVTVRGRHISQFYDWAWHCTPAGPNFIGGWYYGLCNQMVMNFTIRVVVRKYDLTPTITSAPVAIEPGQTVAVRGNVAKSGNIASSSPTDTRYTRIIYKAGQSAPRLTAGTSTTSTACAFYGMTGANASRCSEIGSSMGSTFNNRVFTGSGAAMNQMTDTVPEDFNPGDRICYGLSVRGYSESTGPSKSGARHSALRCVTVGKKPKVHVIGGDLYVGRGSTSGTVTTSVTASGRVEVSVPQEVIDQEVRNTQRFWYFGKGAAFDFYPAQGAGPKNLPKTGVMTGDEGSTVATNREGKVQFFTDGMTVYNPSGGILTNGTGLAAKATTTQAAAVFPISNNRYVIVTSSAATEDNSLGSLRYSVVNMTRGEVTIKNRPLGPQAASDRVGEALSVVPKGDEGYWVVTNKPGTVTIRAFYIPYNWTAGSTDGASIAPVDSNPGDGVVSGKASGALAPGFGTINFYTPDGGKTYTKMVITMRRETGTGTIRVLNFNASTGRFTGQFAWNVGGVSVYSGDFSPDGNYVYYTSLYNNGMNGHLHRYKLSGATNSTQVLNSRQSIVSGSSTVLRGCGTSGGGGQVKSAPNGKMYVANKDCGSIGVIDNPSASTVGGIGWRPTGHSLASGVLSSFGLPQTAAVLPTSVEPPEYARTVYGSWSEYGITASGQVNRMASAAGYAGGIDQQGTTLSGISLCSVSLLTFSNQSMSDVCLEPAVGHYQLPSSVRTIIDRFAAQPASNVGTSFAPASLASGVYTPSSTGTITLQSGQMSANRTVVLYAPNNEVVINGNLTYTNGDLTSISQVPQLVIIARNITINTGVTQVDAWLVAKTAGQGNIYTCNRAATSLRTTGDCSTRLVVNGPVISNKIHLRRTAGAGAGNDGPRAAEVFNLRPDAYFWGVAQSSDTGRIPTVMTTELPPRF